MAFTTSDNGLQDFFLFPVSDDTAHFSGGHIDTSFFPTLIRKFDTVRIHHGNRYIQARRKAAQFGSITFTNITTFSLTVIKGTRR